MAVVKLACILQYTSQDMYKMWIFRAIKLLIVCVFTLYCGISHAGTYGITDSSHDLSADSTGSQHNYYTKQTCVFCHTPHRANTFVRPDTIFNTTAPAGYMYGTGGAMLLWNRALSDATQYDLYASSTAVTVSRVRIHSLLCLSCHDGVGALNVVQNFPGDGMDDGFGGLEPISSPTTIGATFDDGINIGGRTPAGGQNFVYLKDDHPISVHYVTARTGKELGFAIPQTVGGVTYVGDPKLRLFSGYVECTTCHDVHNEGVKDPATKYPFLFVDNAGSNLCIQCHLK